MSLIVKNLCNPLLPLWSGWVLSCISENFTSNVSDMPIMIKQSCITFWLCQKAVPLVFTKKLAEIPTAKGKKKKGKLSYPNDNATHPQHSS